MTEQKQAAVGGAEPSAGSVEWYRHHAHRLLGDGCRIFKRANEVRIVAPWYTKYTTHRAAILWLRAECGTGVCVTVHRNGDVEPEEFNPAPWHDVTAQDATRSAGDDPPKRETVYEFAERMARRLDEYKSMGCIADTTGMAPVVAKWNGMPFPVEFRATAAASLIRFRAPAAPSQWHAFGALAQAVAAVASHQYGPWLAKQQRGPFAEARVAALAAACEGVLWGSDAPAALGAIVTACEAYEAARGGATTPPTSALTAAKAAMNYVPAPITPRDLDKALRAYERARSSARPRVERTRGEPGRPAVARVASHRGRGE